MLLPSSLPFLGRFVIPGVETLLLVALIVTNPRRITRQARWSRTVSIGLAVLVIVSNLLSLGLLTADLSNKSPSGENLLVGAMQIRGATVIGFALLFWEVDRATRGSLRWTWSTTSAASTAIPPSCSCRTTPTR